MEEKKGLKSLKYAVAPALLLAVCLLILWGAGNWALPEKLLPYETGFQIFAMLFVLLFLLVTVPCVLYSLYLALYAMIRQHKFICAGLAILLSGCVTAAWIIAVRFFFDVF